MSVRTLAFVLILSALGFVAGCSHSVTTSDGGKVTVDSPNHMTVTDKTGNTATIDHTANSMDVQSKDGTMHMDKNGYKETTKNGETVEGGTSISEADLGVPFYPGSTEIPNTGFKADTQKGKTAMSTRTTSDDGEKIIAFYTGKLGKPQTNMNTADLSMGVWKKDKTVTTVSVGKGDTPGTFKVTVSTATDK